MRETCILTAVHDPFYPGYNVAFASFYHIPISLSATTGGGKRTETWATFVSCLKAVKLNRLVDQIEQQYTDSTGKTSNNT